MHHSLQRFRGFAMHSQPNEGCFFHVARKERHFAISHGLFGLRDYRQDSRSLSFVRFLNFTWQQQGSFCSTATVRYGVVDHYAQPGFLRHPQLISLVWPRGLIVICQKEEKSKGFDSGGKRRKEVPRDTSHYFDLTAWTEQNNSNFQWVQDESTPARVCWKYSVGPKISLTLSEMPAL